MRKRKAKTHFENVSLEVLKNSPDLKIDSILPMTELAEDVADAAAPPGRPLARPRRRAE